jgi:membrane-associated phospholipid phosphatase
MKPPPFWHWPGWCHVGHALVLGGAVTLWFALIYGGADFLTVRRSLRVRFHFDAELAMPFVPASVLIYLSIYFLFWLAPFILRSGRELKSLAWTLAAVIFVAGIGFLLFPAELEFPAPGDMGMWTGLVRFAKQVALTYNLAPSLHVALAVVCVAVYCRQCGAIGKLLLWLWAGAIGVSTLLLHQHYVMDVATGFLLGLAAVKVSGTFSRDKGLMLPARCPRAKQRRS